MSSSGVIIGNSVGGRPNYYFVNWQLATQEVGNNRSLINYQAYARFNLADAQLDNGRVDWNISGANLWYNGGRVYNYAGNLTNHDVPLASGSFWVDHYADGSRDFGISGGIDYLGIGRSSASGAWWLPTIPRASHPTFAKSSYVVGEQVVLNMNRASGSFTHNGTIQMPDEVSIKAFSGIGDQFVWTPDATEIDAMYARMPNNNTIAFATDVNTYNGGTLIGAGSQNITISTNPIIVKPIFTDFSYEDTNAVTLAITGNNQYLIQGYSVLAVKILSAQKALAQKSATMSKYNLAISATSQDVTYATTDINQSLGVLGVNTDTPLVVTATDSRTNIVSVLKTVKVVAYQPPQVTATALRVNNFETSTNIHIEGTVSTLTVATVDKNAVNTASGVQYRYKKTTDTTWSAWINRASTRSGANIASTDFALNLDRVYAWNVQVTIADKLVTTTAELLVSVGIPLFRIGLDGKIYNNEKTIYACPFRVGAIYITTTTPNPSTEFEGTTWALWGIGRGITGVDTAQTEFNTVEKTGGHKLMQAHNHTINESEYNGGGNNVAVGANPTRYAGNAGTNSSGGGDSQNLSPYITAYQWKRTT